MSTLLPLHTAESILSLGILVVKDQNALTHNTRDRMPLGAKGSFVSNLISNFFFLKILNVADVQAFPCGVPGHPISSVLASGCP